MKFQQLFSFPVVISVLMHGTLLVLIAGNWVSADKKEETVYRPHYVNATLVELTPKAIAAPQQPKPQVLETKKREEQQRRQQQERERKQAEEKRLEQKKAQEAKAKAEQERQNKIKAEQAREKAAEDKKRKAEEERKRREQQQREAQERLDAALQKEEQFLSDTSDGVNVQSYEGLIRQRVVESWSRPPSARNGMQAVLEITMVPTGQVINVRVIKGSGDIAFDRSAEQAVKRVDRFSEIQGMPNDIFERHFRVFRLLFQPEDLRQ
jgi:colicin import membrane protein